MFCCEYYLGGHYVCCRHMCPLLLSYCLVITAWKLIFLDVGRDLRLMLHIHLTILIKLVRQQGNDNFSCVSLPEISSTTIHGDIGKVTNTDQCELRVPWFQLPLKCASLGGMEATALGSCFHFPYSRSRMAGPDSLCPKLVNSSSIGGFCVTFEWLNLMQLAQWK